MFTGKVIIGSSSPRRKALVEGLGVDCEVRTQEVEEHFPTDLMAENVPAFLAELKAQPLLDSLKGGEVLLTSDTVVVMNDRILQKPKDRDDAIRMLQTLSGEMNKVVTGVCLHSIHEKKVFSSETKVYFNKLREEDIIYYVDKYKPFDKAGAYGIQEWIGQIGVSHIEGCFYNVMGLPVHQVWEYLHQIEVK